jgi:N,N'-diacetylbacillosaminyl-diphospho-undecaprenol alpha-1,3-N-acetylgalactosaminyltransferase
MGSKPRSAHVAFLSHLAGNILFRRALIRTLLKRGWRVTVLVPSDSQAIDLEAEDITWVNYELKREGVNPIFEIAVISDLCRKLKRLRPDLLHTFTVKPNIYGTLAGRLAGVSRVVNSVTGLGSFFVRRPGLKPMMHLLTGLYWLSGRFTDAVVFQNTDDRELFLRRGLVAPERAHLIPGSGVDLERFAPGNFGNEDRRAMRAVVGVPEPAVVVTMLARLIWDKGIREFCNAAEDARQEFGRSVVFLLVGRFDNGNPRGVPRNYIDSQVGAENICYLGFREDVPAILAISDVVVLPSYREGLPVSLQEAMAMAKPLVATDTPGCREAVDNEVNGLLVPVQDARALALAIRRLIVNPTMREAMGLRGRDKAEKLFDEKKIVEKHLTLYDNLLANRWHHATQSER